jgi:TRIAD3 protein (E3 ubiquitin-protein ligase RNF216)
MKCLLWDPVEQRHSEEVSLLLLLPVRMLCSIRFKLDQVRQAAKKALEEYKRQHPDMDQEELKAVEVELPPAPPAPVAGPAHLPAYLQPYRPPVRNDEGMMQRLADAQVEAQARMRQIMAPQPNPALINFNLNFGMPPLQPAFAAPAARAAGRQRRARRR